MATKKKVTNTNTEVKKVEQAAVIADNISEEAPQIKATGATVTLAVHLPLSHVFDDIPDGQGGTKCIQLPGLNAPDGILLGVGKAKAVTLPLQDWEAIQKLHGHERMFNSWNGNPPCVMVIKSLDALKGDEVQAMKHGVEPVDPRSVGVETVKEE